MADPYCTYNENKFKYYSPSLSAYTRDGTSAYVPLRVEITKPINAKTYLNSKPVFEEPLNKESIYNIDIEKPKNNNFKFNLTEIIDHFNPEKVSIKI